MSDIGDPMMKDLTRGQKGSFGRRTNIPRTTLPVWMRLMEVLRLFIARTMLDNVSVQRQHGLTLPLSGTLEGP